LSPEDLEEIENLLEERGGCKARRDFDAADDIRDKLQADYSIRVDDRSKEWHVVTNSYLYVPSAHQLEEQDVEFIQDQMSQRASAKLKADYETADNIRDSLMDQFAVSIDDRLKEWTVVVDPSNRMASPDTGSNFTADDVEDDVSETEETDNQISDEEEEEVEEEEEDVKLENMTVVQLKEKLKARGLPVSGRKAELIERLS